MSTAQLLFAAAAEEGTSTLIRTEAAIVILIAIAAFVAVMARRFQFPFTVALVIAGFAATALGDLVAIDVSPDLILFLLVPPLLFEATLHIPWAKLKADLGPVLVNALVGTLIGTLALGWLVHVVLDLPWEASFAFGALISATDPVAVIAFFKSLGTPKRLSVLVEGESLFNDAVAVVAFGVAVAAAEGGGFTVGGALENFFVVSLGGIAVGLVLGYVVSEVILARVDDGLIETTTSLALAYGSFLVAEEFGVIIGQDDLHFSGILAVVVAGLLQGNLGVHNTSPSTRVTLEHSWEIVTFLVNSLVFLFIGLTVSISDLADEFVAMLVAIVAVVIMRILIVYGLSNVSGGLFPKRKVPIEFQHVMFWGGLRGAISLALALTLSEKVFDPETVQTIRVMTFGVVLFTLLVQGTTIAALIRRLGLAGKDDRALEQQRHQARLVMGRAGQSEIARLGADGVVSDDMADAMQQTYQDSLNTHTANLTEHSQAHPEMAAAMLYQARRDALAAERSALGDVQRTGFIDGQVAKEMSLELDHRFAALDEIEDRYGSNLDVDVDTTDLEDTIEALVAEELAWLRSIGPGNASADAIR